MDTGRLLPRRQPRLRVSRPTASAIRGASAARHGRRRRDAEIHRVNIAERLYRVTGGGIYADSVLVGDKTPLKEPLLDGQVLGSDTCSERGPSGKDLLVLGRHQPASLSARQFPTCPGPSPSCRATAASTRKSASTSTTSSTPRASPRRRPGCPARGRPGSRPGPADRRRRPRTAVRLLRQGRTAAQGLRARPDGVRRRQGGVREIWPTGT